MDDNNAAEGQARNASSEEMNALSVEPKESTIGTPIESEEPDAKKPKGGNRKKFIVGGIVAAALVIIGGSGVFAYNAWYQNPEKVVSDAVMNALKARTLSGQGTIAVKSDNYKINLTLDTKNSSEAGLMDMKADIEAGEGDQKMSLSVNGSAVYKDGILYFKVTNLKGAVDEIKAVAGVEEVPGYVDAVVKKIDGQWVSVKSSDYEEVDEEVAKQQECLNGVVKKIETDKEMTNELVSLYSKNKFIMVENSLGSKDINGVGSLGYEIKGDNIAAESFARGLDETKFGKSLRECDKEISFTEIADDIADNTKTNQSVSGSVKVWISRFGHEFTQITANVKEDESTADIVFNTTFNKDVSVEAPTGAISMKQLVEEIEKVTEAYYQEQMEMMLENQGEGVDYSTYNLN